MKELSIEEKAKAYDERFVKAKEIHDNENDVLILHTIEDIFPELKENKDEEIKGLLIDYFKKFKKEQGEFGAKEFWGIPTNDIITWLERQGEIDKVSYKIAEKEKYEK